MSRSLSTLAHLLLILVVPGGSLLAIAQLVCRRSKGVEVWSVRALATQLFRPSGPSTTTLAPSRPADHATKDLVPSAGGLEPAVKQAHKLEAALDYLGDRLVTHAASRFKPSSRPLLDRWREHRRGRRDGTSIYLVGGFRSWLTETELPRLPEVAESRRPTMRKAETLRYARLDQRKQSNSLKRTAFP
ncbi:MAG TPA: hypothetical protein VN326_10925 [Casimicrobiaceae bacterium]|nr:hypothetical protein [Casimicrobiaceae bacterium]